MTTRMTRRWRREVTRELLVSYSTPTLMRALNRVNPERFATSALAPGAIDVRDRLAMYGRLGRGVTGRYAGPDLRSRVTRFGQGVAFQAPRIITMAELAKPAAAKPAPAPKAPTPIPTSVIKTAVPGLPPIVLPFIKLPTINLGPVSTTGTTGFHNVATALKPPSPAAPASGGPSSPTSGGAPAVPKGTGITAPKLNPLIPSWVQSGGVTDQGFTPAAPSAATGIAPSGGGGPDLSTASNGLTPTDGGGATGPNYTTLALMAVAVLGVAYLATRN